MTDLIMSQKDINWTILGDSMKKPQKSMWKKGGVPARDMETSARRDSAKMMVDIIKAGGLHGMVLNVQTLPGRPESLSAAISNINEVRAFSTLTGPVNSSVCRSRSNNSSYGASSPNMLRLLDDLRKARVNAPADQLRYERHRRQMASARYNAMKAGMIPFKDPDFQDLRAIYSSVPKKPLLDTDLHVASDTGGLPDAERAAARRNAPLPETKHEEKETVFDNLLEVLCDSSKHPLSEQLFSPVMAVEEVGGEEWFHPREEYTRRLVQSRHHGRG
jgi:hypothetical protein